MAGRGPKSELERLREQLREKYRKPWAESRTTEAEESRVRTFRLNEDKKSGRDNPAMTHVEMALQGVGVRVEEAADNEVTVSIRSDMGVHRVILSWGANVRVEGKAGPSIEDAAQEAAEKFRAGLEEWDTRLSAPPRGPPPPPARKS